MIPDSFHGESDERDTKENLGNFKLEGGDDIFMMFVRNVIRTFTVTPICITAAAVDLSLKEIKNKNLDMNTSVSLIFFGLHKYSHSDLV